MWRPVTRTLLVLSCSTCLFSATGCSLFRADPADAFAATPPLHLPETTESAASEAPPADPLAARTVSATSNMPVPLAATATETTTDERHAEPTEGFCYVEIRASGEKPKRIKMSLDDATFVQKVLEQTGLIREFRNMEIELSRKLPAGGRHKMEVRYDRKQKQVISAFDYALHPHDLLVVREDTATSFDEMLKKLAGPLAR